VTRERALVYELNEYCLLHAEAMDVETVKAFQHVSTYLFGVTEDQARMMGGEWLAHDAATICRDSD